MKLLLFINGNPFNEINLPVEEFESDPDSDFETNVDIKAGRLQVYIDQVKTLFYRPLCKASNYEIVLVVESKMNNLKFVTEDEYQQMC